MNFDPTIDRGAATLPATLRASSTAWMSRGSEAPKVPKRSVRFDVVGHLIDGEERLDPARSNYSCKGPDLRFEPYDRFRHRARNAGRTLSGPCFLSSHDCAPKF